MPESTFTTEELKQFALNPKAVNSDGQTTTMQNLRELMELDDHLAKKKPFNPRSIYRGQFINLNPNR